MTLPLARATLLLWAPGTREHLHSPFPCTSPKDQEFFGIETALSSSGPHRAVQECSLSSAAATTPQQQQKHSEYSPEMMPAPHAGSGSCVCPCASGTHPAHHRQLCSRLGAFKGTPKTDNQPQMPRAARHSSGGTHPPGTRWPGWPCAGG